MDELQLQHDLLEDEEYYHEEELLHQVAVLGALIIAGADEADNNVTSEDVHTAHILCEVTCYQFHPLIHHGRYFTLHKMTGHSSPQ
jgi:hypothetical protein